MLSRDGKLWRGIRSHFRLLFSKATNERLAARKWIFTCFAARIETLNTRQNRKFAGHFLKEKKDACNR